MEEDKGYAKADWQQHYDEDDLRWDLGKVSPPLVKTWEKHRWPLGRVIIPGCGQGHEVVFFASQGYHVVAVDFAKGAIQRLKQNIENKALPIEAHCQNFFHLDDSHDGRYDLMFEQTFFCAIHPDERKLYVKKVQAILRPAGLLVGVFYNTGDDESGPPYNTTENQIRQEFKNHFDILEMGPCLNSVEQRDGKEILAVLKKKD